MKIAVIAHRFHTNLYYRIKSLQDIGFHVKVFVLYQGKSEYYQDIDICNIKPSIFSSLFSKIFNKSKKTYLKSFIEIIIQSPSMELGQKIKSFKPDIIIIKEFKSVLCFKSLMIAKRNKINVYILTQTDKTTIRGSKPLFKLFINFMSKMGVKGYITPVERTHDKFKNIGIINIYYIPFVYPIPNTIDKINQNPVRILSIGKYVKRKDHLLLIKAIESCLKKGYMIELNIFGEIGDKVYFFGLQNYISKNKLSDKIFLNKNLHYSDIIQEYSRNHIFILPSYKEPAAYSPVEAMAHGLPVICSDECGTKCYIRESVNGYIFKARDKNDLQDKILRLISDTEILKKMSKATKNIHKNHHNPEIFAKKFINILSK